MIQNPDVYDKANVYLEHLLSDQLINANFTFDPDFSCIKFERTYSDDDAAVDFILE